MNWVHEGPLKNHHRPTIHPAKNRESRLFYRWEIVEWRLWWIAEIAQSESQRGADTDEEEEKVH